MADAAVEEERYHFQRVIGSFMGYEAEALIDTKMSLATGAAARLDEQARRLLPEKALEHKVASLREAIATNAAFLRAVVRNQGSFGPLEAGDVAPSASSARSRPREADHSKVRSTLHSCVRDWAAEGAAERAQSYAPLLGELRRLVPAVCDGRRSRVLVPGAGLGRLVLEIAAAGYDAQGNEFSYHMLLVSNFVLNGNLDVESLPVAPFVDQPSNQQRAQDRTRVIRLPDIAPADMLAGEHEPPLDFSMVAGEFLEVYSSQMEQWDAIVTCFFLDTAPVAIDYVTAIHRLLKPGRPWINMGPLLYHWVPGQPADIDADDRYAQSIELAWDELRHCIVAAGFEILSEEWRQCNYTSNARSMMRTQYDCVFFTAAKRIPQTAAGDGQSVAS